MNPSPVPTTQERESTLFALALEKPLTERSAFLQAVCGMDNVLRQRLEALLAAHDQPDNLVPTQAEAARPTIKLYLAEQTEPVRRRVALKVIKLGMDTKQVVGPVRGGAAGAGDDGSSQHRQGARC